MTVQVQGGCVSLGVVSGGWEEGEEEGGDSAGSGCGCGAAWAELSSGRGPPCPLTSRASITHSVTDMRLLDGDEEVISEC